MYVCVCVIGLRITPILHRNISIPAKPSII